ncbi:MAG: aa3-type cytochrome c oxidase subunit IV [Pseudorhodobacter sp.]|nr:aa3-type cytochrome c oxidase subunit IV [Pseudorhodobacter sp.]
MADYKRGSMDIRGQEKTFAGFVRMVTWGGGIVIALLILLALVNG